MTRDDVAPRWRRSGTNGDGRAAEQRGPSLVDSAEAGGLVERSADGAYRLGLRLVALSDRVLGQLDVREQAGPWLTWLVQELVAILGLQGPAARLPAATRRNLLDPLLRAAREVSHSPGGPG